MYIRNRKGDNVVMPHHSGCRSCVVQPLQPVARLCKCPEGAVVSLTVICMHVLCGLISWYFGYCGGMTAGMVEYTPDFQAGPIV
jgi:hypothetical protein